MRLFRKNLLIWALAAFGVVSLAHFGQAETIYLSDSDAGGSGKSQLYTVSLDPTLKRAYLTALPTLGYDNVDAIALTPKDNKIYFVDKNLDILGYYDITGNTTKQIGTLQAGTTTLTDVVLAAFSPGGTLYIANQKDNNLYTVNLESAKATLVGKITGATVLGNDLAFDSGGNLYLRSNSNQTLYQLTISEGKVSATSVGSQAYNGTGLAFLADGAGNLLVSQANSQNMHIVDKSNGTTLDTYTMYLSGSPYNCGYGDLAATLVPIPASVLLLGSGLLGLGLLSRRRKTS